MKSVFLHILLLPICRDLMREKKITFGEGKEARKLLNMPGGLELHIGVNCYPDFTCTHLHHLRALWVQPSFDKREKKCTCKAPADRIITLNVAQSALETNQNAQNISRL
jgi:hypothetical protein